MGRIPLDTVGEPEEVERPCDCCGEPTVFRVSLTPDDSLPCCGRPTCRQWVTEMLFKMD